MPIGYIYLLVDKKNKKEYVGQHRASTFDEKYYGSGRIIKDIMKNNIPAERFDRVILTWCESFDELDTMEQYYVKERVSMHPHGYNLTSGGEQAKCYSDETRKKISEAVSNEKHRLFGKHHSQETIEKIRINNIGKKKINTTKGTPEYIIGRQNQIKSLQTEEYRKKISELTKGEKNPRYITLDRLEFISSYRTMTIKEVMNKFNIGKGTVYNKLKEYQYGK